MSDSVFHLVNGIEHGSLGSRRPIRFEFKRLISRAAIVLLLAITEWNRSTTGMEKESV
jgi:hypothetical protein